MEIKKEDVPVYTGEDYLDVLFHICKEFRPKEEDFPGQTWMFNIRSLMDLFYEVCKWKAKDNNPSHWYNGEDFDMRSFDVDGAADYYLIYNRREDLYGIAPRNEEVSDEGRWANVIRLYKIAD